MTKASRSAFADRLTALVEERSSQVCVGLDPDPAVAGEAFPDVPGNTPAEQAATAVAMWCEHLLAATGPACVAVKPQLACFERLGAPGWAALARIVDSAHDQGLLVIADGKRGDVPVSASAYAQALFGSTPSPFGDVPGLGADAATLNGTLGRDSLEPLLTGAREAGAGLFVLVRTSNAGAADLLDLPAPDVPFHERLAAMVDGLGADLEGQGGLSGLGAVVGATEPAHIARLRELMPRSPFLVPGVGAQGGRTTDLSAAFSTHPASAIVTASRSVAGADDPAEAAEILRREVWDVSCRALDTG
ncbi:MAG: orotidine-5'-phosphate decarboxylase [Actinomycetota bacterium]|nr:orotidine-5'-phosphate decarboxylase [Actinomycetota bacterium]